MKTRDTFLFEEADDTGGGGGFSIETMFGGPPEAVTETTTEAAVEATESPVADPVDPVEKPAEVTSGDPAFDAFAKWMKDAYPENPEGIKNVNNWKESRSLSEKLGREYGAVQLRLSQAEKELAEARKAGGSVLPEAEAVKKLSAELETLRTSSTEELNSLREIKSKYDLENNAAFRQQFDGQRAGLLASAQEVAKEAGIDPAIVDKVFQATSEYSLARAIGAVEDADAKQLLAVKARAFMDLTKQRDAAVKNPLDSLKEWKNQEEALIGKTAKGFTAAFGDQLYAALPTVQDKLKADPFMSTPAGAAQYERFSQMFKAGDIPDAPTLVEALVRMEAGEVYRETASRLASRNTLLEQQLAKLTRLDPALSGGAENERGSVSRGGFDIERPLGGG